MIRLFPERGGWLEVVCGPMFCGKSEELIRRLRRAEIAGQRVLILKPQIDDRYDIGHVVSHAGAKMRAVAVSRPEEIIGLVEGYDAIGIDEVQFFAPEIVLVIDLLVERGMRVVAAGLDQDFRGLPFGAMPELLCRAELVDKLQAVCHRCGGPATMTQRLVGGQPGTRGRRDDRRRRARLVRSALPHVPRARRACARDRIGRRRREVRRGAAKDVAKRALVCGESAAIAAGGSFMASATRARSSTPAGVSASVFTRRSAPTLRRSTRPRASSRSAMPVTFDASQNRRSASALIGDGGSGSRRRSACACANVRPSSASASPTLARCTIPIWKKSCCASRAADVVGAVFTAMVQIILDDVHTCLPQVFR